MQCKYYYSPIGFSALWQNDLFVGIYLFILIACSQFTKIGGVISVLGFVILLLYCSVPLYMRRPSPLFIGQKRITEFYTFGINWHINIPVSLVAYENAMEINLYIDSLMVPYCMIVGGPMEVGRLKKSIRILINVPGLPKVLTIHSNKKVRTELSEFIKSKVMSDRC